MSSSTGDQSISDNMSHCSALLSRHHSPVSTRTPGTSLVLDGGMGGGVMRRLSELGRKSMSMFFSGSIYMDGGVGIYSLVAGWHHLLAACGAVCSVVSVLLYLLSTTINQMSVSCSALCSLLAADTNTPTQHNSSHLHLHIFHCRVWRIPIPVMSGLNGNSKQLL